jgi:hypothetical protein
MGMELNHNYMTNKEYVEILRKSNTEDHSDMYWMYVVKFIFNHKPEPRNYGYM